MIEKFDLNIFGRRKVYVAVCPEFDELCGRFLFYQGRGEEYCILEYETYQKWEDMADAVTTRIKERRTGYCGYLILFCHSNKLLNRTELKPETLNTERLLNMMPELTNWCAHETSHVFDKLCHDLAMKQKVTEFKAYFHGYVSECCMKAICRYIKNEIKNINNK